MSDLSAYEAAEAIKIIEHRRNAAARADGRVRELLDAAGRRAKELVEKVPVPDAVRELATQGYEGAIKGVMKALTNSARLSLRQRGILRKYARHDPTVTTFRAIRSLDLEVIDSIRPHGLAHTYAAAAGIEGAATGFLVSGGEIIAGGGAILGAGAAAAPGFGVIASAFAADSATVLVSGTRLVLHTGSFYGYDPRDQGEELFAGAILNLATAGGMAAKNAAYVDLFKLTNLLVRNAPWVKLNHTLLARLLGPLFERLSLRLTKMKLGQAVPIAGIVVGAGMNYAMLDRIGETAHWAYRERFLREKGYPFPAPADSGPGPDDDGGDEPISIIAIAEDEGISLPDDLSSDQDEFGNGGRH